MKRTKKGDSYWTSYSLPGLVVLVYLGGVLSLCAVISNTGCGHPYGPNYIYYPCDQRHGPPCSKELDSCLFEWLPPGIYWGSCENTGVDVYDCITDTAWYGNTTSIIGECQSDCACALEGLPFEDRGGGAMSYYGGTCAG